MSSYDCVADAFEQEKIKNDSKQIELALEMTVEESGVILSPGGNTGNEDFVIDVTYQPTSSGCSGIRFPDDDNSSYAASQSDGLSSAGVSYDHRSSVQDDELPCSLETCLALNRAYQQLIQENLLQIEVMLSKNQQRQLEVRYILSGGKTKRVGPEQKRRTYWCEKSYYFRGSRTADVSM